jgi:glycosyltransferase involved in cell wall biosynthesis
MDESDHATASDLKAENQTSLRRVKLLMLSHYFEDHRGGIEIVASALTRELARLEFQVIWLATGNLSESPTDSRVSRRVLDASNVCESLLKIPYPIIFPSAYGAIFAEAKRADIILVHDALYMTSIAAYFAARIYRKPFLVVQHIGLVPYRNAFLQKLMLIANRFVTAPILRRADQVIFISQLTFQYFSDLAVRRAPALIFNGVDTLIFSPPADDAQIENARRELDLPFHVPIALFVGRFVEKKGLAIIEKMARIRGDHLFVFAGWGALDPAAWNLPNVRVYRSLSGSSLASLYRASSFLLLPSVGEGFPLVVQEALACGLPVICGIDTARADSRAASFLTGIEVDLEDPDRTAQFFSEEMTRLLARPETEAGRLTRSEFAKANYSWGGAAAAYASLLKAFVPI